MPLKNMNKIYRGIWADRLDAGEELPAGGSVFSDELTTRLELNFDSFNPELDNYRTPQKVSQAYDQSKESVREWLTQNNADVDPYLFFVANTVQKKVQSALNVRPESKSNVLERIAKFKEGKSKLTDLKGVAMCAEQAALGQYLLQNVLQAGYSSAYMSGVTAQSPRGEIEDHSFLVISAPDKGSYVFDISRPLSGSNLPRMLKTKVPLTYENLADTKNLLIEATEVLQGNKLYFGVGNPMLEQEAVIAK
jgi:hypothetical protein